MLFFTLKTIFISLLLIALIHYLYSFFKHTLTIPKVKDLVNKPAKRYDEMLEIMNNKVIGIEQHGVVDAKQYVDTTKHMQDELKTFLNELKKPDVIKYKNTMTNHFTEANSMNSSAYAEF